jgi:hypothetical protein
MLAASASNIQLYTFRLLYRQMQSRVSHVEHCHPKEAISTHHLITDLGLPHRQHLHIVHHISATHASSHIVISNLLEALNFASSKFQPSHVISRTLPVTGRSRLTTDLASFCMSFHQVANLRDDLRLLWQLNDL